MDTYLKAILALLLFTASVKCDSALYNKATVTATRFGTPNELQQQTVNSNLQRALAKCSTSPWCTVMCEVSATSYILSNLLVSGGAQDNLPGDKLTCFTKRPIPGVFPSPTAVVADSSPPKSPEQVPSNIVDGTYGHDIDECFFGNTGSGGPGPYVVFDFGSVRKVGKVLVRIQPSGAAYNKFQAIEVRLGYTESSDPFHDYDMFATYFETPKINQEIVLKSLKPMEGRFISFKQTSGYQLQFCHLEIS